MFCEIQKHKIASKTLHKIKAIVPHNLSDLSDYFTDFFQGANATLFAFKFINCIRFLNYIKHHFWRGEVERVEARNNYQSGVNLVQSF